VRAGCMVQGPGFRVQAALRTTSAPLTRNSCEAVLQHLPQPYIPQWFDVQGPGFRVQVQSPVFSIQGSGCQVQGSGLRVQGPGFRVQDSGFRVPGSGSRVQCSGLRPPPRGGRERRGYEAVAFFWKGGGCGSEARFRV